MKHCLYSFLSRLALPGLMLLILVSAPLGASTLVSDPPIITAPIHVSGGGDWDDNFIEPGGGWSLNFSFSGTNGTDSVNLVAFGGFDMGSVTPDYISNQPVGHFPEPYMGSATIDGVNTDFVGPFGRPNVVQFLLTGGSGSVEIIDSSTNNLLAEADIIGYIQITSDVKTYGIRPGGTYGLIEESGTFNILPTPEPASAIFVGVIAIGVGLAKLRRISAPRRCRSKKSCRPTA
jgi:hypothetical protein